MNADLTDCKAKLLKLEEKERRWEVDIQLLKESETELKATLAIKERELQGRSAASAIQSVGVVGEIDTSSLSRAMSQIGLKDRDIVKLKQQIKELEKEKGEERQGKEKMEEKCQGPIQQNAKLSQQVVGKLALQGTRHLIWDQIIIEADKFQPYLDFIEDQESAIGEAKKKVLTVLGEI